ncbi:MAG: hypothetical protein FWH02_03380 [Oscillospiraceae bacterium]|nr:hypothetical protein [Oscillospiraceae bacterium]
MLFDSTTLIIGAIIALVCIAVGIVLLSASHDYLKTNAFFNGGKHRKGAALIIYRFSGAQMVAMGTLLLLAAAGFGLGAAWLAWPSLVIVMVLPMICSSYMKRSKRFK